MLARLCALALVLRRANGATPAHLGHDLDALAASSSSPTTAARAPVLLWSSSPVLPNETLMVHGNGWGMDPTVFIRALSSPSSKPVQVSTLQSTLETVMFVVPAHFPVDAYEVIIEGAGGPSNALIANAPELWWVQGDGGEVGTPGGWLRAFGRTLSLSAEAASAGRAGRGMDVALFQLAERLGAAARRGDWVEAARITTEQGVLLEQVAQSDRRSLASKNSLASLSSTLTLAPVDGGANLTIPASGNLSCWAARFEIPSSALPGEYFVTISNGAASGFLDEFYSQHQPRVQTVRIVVAAALAWPEREFDVTQTYGCTQSVDNTSSPVDCTEAVSKAIAAAGAAGGGVVKFGLGRYYIKAPLLLPHNVRLVGAGMGKTALYFATQDQVRVDLVPRPLRAHTN